MQIHSILLEYTKNTPLIIMEKLKLNFRAILLFNIITYLKFIANSPDSFYFPLIMRIFFQFSTQSLYMAIYRSTIADIIISPNLFNNISREKTLSFFVAKVHKISISFLVSDNTLLSILTV